MWSIILIGLLNSYIGYKYSYSLNKKSIILFIVIILFFEIKKDYIGFLIFYLLLFNSISDHINHDVYLIPNILLMTIGIVFIKVDIRIRLFSITLFPLILLVLAKITNKLGMGDVQTIFALGFIFDITYLIWIVFIASTLNLIYAIKHKMDAYPFIPFISISTLFIYLLAY